MLHRRSGILIHITSLPSRYGIGDLGPGAYRFVDFLAQTNQSLWQILPLNPTTPVASHSPYSGTSAFAGNPLLISPDNLIEQGLLSRDDVDDLPQFDDAAVDYDKVAPFKIRLLEKAYHRFARRSSDPHYEQFCYDSRHWLEDYALFRAIRENRREQHWSDWPAPLRDRHNSAMQAARQEWDEDIRRTRFRQYIFHRQWQTLHEYAKNRGVQIVGDLPLYVTYDSAEVWANTRVFQLSRDKKPKALSGMPPSRFAMEGQFWGMPLYNWSYLKRTGYEWWLRRIEHNLNSFDWLRIDHFLGLISYWKIPPKAKLPTAGHWVKGPRGDLFHALYRRFSLLPLMVEDLGFVTVDSRELMNRYNLAGMRVLIDSFTGEGRLSRFSPHNYISRCVAYTGTHDNNTARGWFDSARPEDRWRFFRYVGWHVPPEEVHWEMVRLVMMSVANAAVFPMQDILGLGADCRMNKPGTTHGNWVWRLRPEQLSQEITVNLADITRTYGRA